MWDRICERAERAWRWLSEFCENPVWIGHTLAAYLILSCLSILLIIAVGVVIKVLVRYWRWLPTWD